MPSATNIIAGSAELYFAPFGATEPLDTAVASALSAPYVNLGGTDDGVTLNVSHDWFKLRMDQVIDAAGARKTGRTITVATNLVEGTLENLALAMAQAASSIASGGTGGTAWRSLEAGGDDSGAEPDYQSIILRGRAPAGKRRLFICRKVLQTEDVESAYKKDDQWLIPVTFECFWVTTSIRPFKVVDEATA
jgi:hypothetical protein